MVSYRRSSSLLLFRQLPPGGFYTADLQEAKVPGEEQFGKRGRNFCLSVMKNCRLNDVPRMNTDADVDLRGVFLALASPKE
jgi:hypothetical protein